MLFPLIEIKNGDLSDFIYLFIYFLMETVNYYTQT